MNEAWTGPWICQALLLKDGSCTEKNQIWPSSGTTYSWQSIPSPWVFIRFQQHQIMSNLSDWTLWWWGLNKTMNCNWAGLVNEMRAWMNTLGGLEGLTHIFILNHSSFTTCQNSPWLFTTYIACCCIEVAAHLANLHEHCEVSICFPMILRFGPARSKR